MYSIVLKIRELKLLRDNMTGNPEGYDYTDLQILDHLAKKATVLLGDYATTLAALGREEKAINRRIRRAQGLGAKEAISAELLGIEEHLETLNEKADAAEPIDFQVEDGYYELIKAKVEAQKGWLGLDDIRGIVLGMIAAVKGAEPVADPVMAKAKPKPPLALVPKEEEVPIP